MRQRSYLDTVNAGRVRRAGSDLDAISSTLTGLEAELDRLALNRPTRTNPAPHRPLNSLRRDEAHSLSSDIAASASIVERVVREIEALKSEVRAVKPVTLEREVGELRGQLSSIQNAVERSSARGDMTGEFARLHNRLEALPKHGGNAQIDTLRDEMEELRHAISQLAREESVRAVQQGWHDFDNRFATFQDSLIQKLERPRDSQELLELADRVYNLQELVASLPETLPIGTLEKQIGTLAKAIERIATQQSPDMTGSFVAIEDRLDELSRAIVASSVANTAPAFDSASIDRLESRISAIARQIEEAASTDNQQQMLSRLEALGRKVDQALEADMDSDALLRAFDDRLQVLHRRIEDLALSTNDNGAAGSDMGGEIVARLNEIERKLENRKAPVIDEATIARQLESRLHAISLQIEETRSRSGYDEAFRALEGRLADIAARLDSAPVATGGAPVSLFHQIEDRIEEIVQRLDRPQTVQPNSDGTFQLLESRLADITARLDSAVSNPQGQELPALANLEAQIADISRHIGSFSGSTGADLEPRLSSIEKSIALNHDIVLEAARAAAESALAKYSRDSDAVVPLALSEDLKALESLARKTEERNSKTFSAIHDTLLKIVDRIGSLETGAPQVASAATASRVGRPKLPDSLVPALDPAQDEPLPPLSDASFGTLERKPARSPAEAAVAAAKAALSETQSRSGDSRAAPTGIASSLARALGRKKEPAIENNALPGTELPKADFSLPEIPAVEADATAQKAERAGGPDLNAIMRRVRDERSGAARATADESGKQDFLAAARRAAQAAAAEVESLSKHEAKRKGESASKFAIADLMARQRKPLAIAACAVLLAIASWQMSKTFFAGAKVAAPAPAMQGTKVPEAKPAIESSKADTKPAAALPAAGEKPVRIVGTDAVPGNDPEPQSFKPLAKDGGQAPVETAKLQPREAADSARTDAISPGSSGDDLSATAPIKDTGAAIPAGLVPDADAGPAALRDAASSGDTVAMFEIASRYADGRNGQQDLKRAYDWYKQAAEAGFAPAQYRIGSMLEKGMGAAKDIKQAKTWYQMAAAQGNASAMHNLAVLFAMGADSAPDTQSAAEWFQKAAELGVKDSQYNLGILAANGDGMKQSLEESYKWFALAAKAGDKEASKKRDEVFKVLRPEQREKARVTTELWKPKALDPKANNVEVPEEWRAAKDTTASVDVRKAIRNVQGILNKNGFDAGVADGVMGQKTINAIKAFQKANGLPVTGQVDHALVKALLAKN